MIKRKKINDKPGAPGKEKKDKNPFLKPNGSFDLIEEFPSYKDEKKGKAKG